MNTTVRHAYIHPMPSSSVSSIRNWIRNPMKTPMRIYNISSTAYPTDALSIGTKNVLRSALKKSGFFVSCSSDHASFRIQ
jgi:hypothetical protein